RVPCGDALRAIAGHAVVRLELEVQVIQVLVEEEVQARLEVAAVTEVHARVAGISLRGGECHPVAVGRCLEVAERRVWRDEAEPVMSKLMKPANCGYRFGVMHPAPVAEH